MTEIKIWQSVVLGIVQGLTEFVPVSSTAHLKIIAVLSTSMGQHFPDPGAAYSAVIQLGTLLSLVVFFRNDLWVFLWSAIQGLKSGRPFENSDARLAWYLVLATIPVSVFGLLLSDFIKGPFRSMYVIACSLIILALFLWLADVMAKKSRDINQLNWKDAILIGIGQSIALVPGSSRSGTTLTAGLLCGFSRYSAMRFSFLLAIPAIGLSGFYELFKDFHELQNAGLAGLAVGTLTSVVVGYITVAALLHYLRSHSTLVFVVYRIILGVALLMLLYFGVLEP